MEDIIAESSKQSKKLIVGYKYFQKVAISERVFAHEVVLMAEKEQYL